MTSPPVHPAPDATVLGEPDAPRHAVVLAPVMPRWDSGAFFQQVTEPLLGSGHRITIYDTLSLLRDGDGLKALVDRWAAQLAPCADGLDVLAGNALGGAVVQALLAREWTHRARVLLLSAPTVADAGLNGKLERIAAAVGTQGLPAAARLLDEAVSGPGGQPFTGTAAQSGQPPVYDGESAGRRLAAGLRLLRDVDLREPVRAFPGPLLHLYGEQSLLVQRRHLAAGSRPDHCLVGIPQAGMRPHTDRPDLVRDAVARFLRAEKP